MFGEKKPAMSGPEMMLRSLGMGEVLDMAKALANDGTFNKILEFANKADEILTVLKRIEGKLDHDAHARTEGSRRTENEPGPGADDGGPVGAPLRLVSGLPE